VLPNHAVQPTPLARSSPGCDLGRQSTAASVVPYVLSTASWRRLAHCLCLLVPAVVALTTPASGAADSSALGGHVIFGVPSARVVRFRDHGLREEFRAISPLCSRSWGAAHARLVRDGGALVAPAPRRSPSSCSGRRGVNRALPAAPRAATTCRLTSAMQLTPLRGP
jgi:hypothetical protein